MEHDWKAGNVVDGWRLDSLLGAGGNGEVWRATRNDQVAAVKFLKLKFLNPQDKRFLRFRDEVRTQARLTATHSGILPLLDYKVTDVPQRSEPIWLATPIAERVDGVLKEKSLSEVIAAIHDFAVTLAKLHDEGISHRDIKPNNLYRYDSRWVVADLGLVDFPDKDAITETGERVGPADYLAPEMRDESKSADGRKADVYSLAKTLWVLASGQNRPPQGEIRADIAQISLAVNVRHPRANQIDLLIDRSTRHSPDQRPSMADFSAELQAWLSPSEAMAITDVTRLAQRIMNQTTSSRRAFTDRLAQEKQALKVHGRIIEFIKPIADCFAKTGLSNGFIDHMLPVDQVFGRQITLNTPARFKQFGVATSAERQGTPSPWSPNGAEHLSLTCAVGMDLRVDGTTFLFGGFSIESRYGLEHREYRDYARPTGSSQLDEAVTDLLTFLSSSLPKALGLFSQRLESDRPIGTRGIQDEPTE